MPHSDDMGFAADVAAQAAATNLASQGIADLVSIIVPTFNRAALTVELLDNLAQQTWPSWEVIVVDDGSHDDTQMRVRRWQAEHPQHHLKLLHQQNMGPGAARNAGLAQARGEFIYFIDSDDLVFATSLSTMVAAIRASGLPYCVANVVITDLKGVANRSSTEGRPLHHPSNVFSNNWLTHSALYRREVIAKSGPFNMTLRVGEDTEFLWRIVYTNGTGIILGDVVGARREHSYGHLSVGLGDPELIPAKCQAYRVFLDWLEQNHQVTDKMLRHVALNFFYIGAILATEDNMQTRIVVLDFLSSIKHRSTSLNLARRLLQSDSVAIQKTFFLCAIGMRNLRRVLRSRVLFRT